MKRGRGARGALGGALLSAVLLAPVMAGGAPGVVTDTGVVGRPAPRLTDTGVLGTRPAPGAPAPVPGAGPARTWLFTDQRAPGWDIAVTPLAADRYHLQLAASALAAGGVGEARLAFARCGQHLARAQGGEDFVILNYEEGLTTGLFATRRVASGEIQVAPARGR